MRALIRIECGTRRCFVLEHRVHHAWAGLALVTYGTALILSDRHDWRVWVADLVRKP